MAKSNLLYQGGKIMNKVLIIDTCMLCVYLRIPHMDDCGPDDDKWN